MITTKPSLIFIPEAWDVSYLASVEPDADGWTLDGVDHASATGNVLTIATAGTDVAGYYRALPSHVALSAIWSQVDVSITTGCVTAAWEVASATMNAKVVATITADGTIVFTGSSGVSASLTMTSTQRIAILLTCGGWRAYSVSQSTGDLTLLASGVPDTESSNSRVYFGKQSATSDNVAQHWTNVRMVVGDAWACEYPPSKWQMWDYESTKYVNEAWDGTVETVHGYDARSIGFTLNALSDANLSLLAGYYVDYLAPGTAFLLAHDQAAINTTINWVKSLEKKFSPTQDAAVPTHNQLTLRLRVVS